MTLIGGRLHKTHTTGHHNHRRYWWLEGEVVPLRLVDRFVKAAPKCSLVNLYSSWEALDTAHANLTDDRFIVSNRQSLIAPVGAVMPQVQVYVCDDEMRLLRLNQPGNLFVGTPAMFLGYTPHPHTHIQRARETT